MRQALGNTAGNGDVVISAAAGGDVTNTGAIEALNNNNGSVAYIEIFTGSAGSVTNSGSIVASGGLTYDGSTNLTISAGTITNSKNGTIGILATSNSYNYTYDYASVEASTIVNSGSLLASASGSSDDYLHISGGSVTNAKTIEASASQQSYAETDVYGSSIVNSGTIEAIGGADSEGEVYLSGTVFNTSGKISAAGNGQINLYAVTISGGTLATTGSEAAIIAGATQSGVIDGALIAKSSTVLAEASGTVTLGNGVSIGTGAAVEASGADASVTVASGATVTNSGGLLAESGGELIISGGVVNSGAGSVMVGAGGIVDVASGGSANVTFASVDSGILQIADVAGDYQLFGGVVSGFGGVDAEFPGQEIDLINVSSGTAGFSASYVPNVSAPDAGGTLEVISGGVIFAAIALEGNYVSATFNIVSGTNGTIAISDPVGLEPTPTIATAAPVTLAATANPPSLINYVGASNLALLGNYMASMFTSVEGDASAQSTEAIENQAALAHPHTG